MADLGAKNRENAAVNSSFHRPSAKIYQFPTQTRGFQERRKPAMPSVNAYNLGKSSDVLVTGAWYHDAAIKDDDRGRKG
jgi:hypothetical protein